MIDSRRLKKNHFFLLNQEQVFPRFDFASKPLLIDIGIYAACFLVDTAMMCFRQVEKIYRAAGASRNLELDLFPGEHAWGDNKAVEFFRRHLGS